MSFTKIKSNIPPFDELFEGFYLAHPALLSGKRGSGTSTLAIRFLSNLLRIGENVLLFTDQPPDHVSLTAYGLGSDISAAIETEQLSIVPYDEHLPLLPFPEALEELRALITGRHYTFVVFDPVIPWLAAPAAQLEERIEAFFTLLADTAPTAILILPHPVSKIARRLHDEVAARCAICITAARTHEGPYTLTVTKYMGAPPEKCPALLQLPTAPAATTPYPSGALQDLHHRLQHDHTSPMPGAGYGPAGHAPHAPHATGVSGIPGIPPAPAAPSSISTSFFSADPDAPAAPSRVPAARPFQTPATAPLAAAPGAPHPRAPQNASFFAPAPDDTPAAAPAPSAPPAPAARPAARPPVPPAAPAASTATAARPHDSGHPISFANILQDDATFFAAPPDRFATAASSGSPRPPFPNIPPPELPPPEFPFPHRPAAAAAPAPAAPAAPAPAVPAHAAPAPAPAPAAAHPNHPDHAIRFSDIIQ